MVAQDQADSDSVMAAESALDGVALLFAEGQRPSVELIDALLAQLPAESMLSVSYRGEAERGCLELLYRGLAFDLKGLLPGEAAAGPVIRQRLGFDDSLPPLEAVLLAAGPHLEGGAHLSPVLRGHLTVALALTALPGLMAVVWAPAGVMMAPQDFAQRIGGWLQGGAFPAPGLVALLSEDDGALCSHGLPFFTPREVRVEAGDTQAEIASLLIGRLVDGDGHVPAWITDGAGRTWNVSWEPEQGLITARPGA